MQSVSGLHSGTNPISGDFSVGADGLMVRDGAFAEPVREVTIASTLQRMLLDITEIGNDLTFLPGAVAGMTVLVGEMTISGVADPQRAYDRCACPRRVEDRFELGAARPRDSTPKCTASMPYARAAATLSALSSTKTASVGLRLPMREHVSS